MSKSIEARLAALTATVEALMGALAPQPVVAASAQPIPTVRVPSVGIATAQPTTAAKPAPSAPLTRTWTVAPLATDDAGAPIHAASRSGNALVVLSSKNARTGRVFDCSLPADLVLALTGDAAMAAKARAQALATIKALAS